MTRAQPNATVAGDDGLTMQQRRAVALIVESDMSFQVIADEIGVDRITIWRWKQRPEFRAALRSVSSVKIRSRKGCCLPGLKRRFMSRSMTATTGNRCG